jgi:hypothetical protein
LKKISFVVLQLSTPSVICDATFPKEGLDAVIIDAAFPEEVLDVLVDEIIIIEEGLDWIVVKASLGKKGADATEGVRGCYVGDVKLIII